MIHNVVKQIFPALLTIASHLLSLQKNELMLKYMPENDTLQALEMLKCTLKIYNCSMKMEFSKFHQEPESLMQWGNIFIACIQRVAPSSLVFPEDPEDREMHPWWKAKKWAYSILNTFLTRYVPFF